MPQRCKLDLYCVYCSSDTEPSGLKQEHSRVHASETAQLVKYALSMLLLKQHKLDCVSQVN